MLVAMETCFKECLFPCLPLPSLHLESFCCHNSRIRLLPSPCRLPHCGMRWGEIPQPRSRSLGQVKPPWGTALFLPHSTISRGVCLWGPGPPCGQGQRRCLYSLQAVGVPPRARTCGVWKRQPARRASLGHAAACKPLGYTAEGLSPCPWSSSPTVMTPGGFLHHLS